jgi:hypothetical protein
MTKEEALQMALKFIEHVNRDGWVLADFEPEMYACITAIKEALETKDDPVTENGLYRLGYHNGYGFGEAYGKANALQRTWVGLTDEEAQQTFARHNCTISTHLAGILARAILIEAKLKGKNK